VKSETTRVAVVKHLNLGLNVVVSVIRGIKLVRRLRLSRKLSKSQTKLIDDPKPIMVTTVLEPWVKYRCPYCLGEYPIYRFETYTKSNKMSKKAKCPECHATMLKKTLTADMTPSEYGRWLYDSCGYGGYLKISWDKIKMRVKDMGIADTFWTAFKAAKAEKWAEKGIKTDEEIDEAYQQYVKDGTND
jgi:predicted RNA-binding Zn-ribbon protein involved in translation (DUF1610 family)